MSLTDAQVAALLELLEMAQEWRDVLVRSNTPSVGYPADDPDGRAHWARTRNHNGRLVKSVNAATDVMQQVSTQDTDYATFTALRDRLRDAGVCLACGTQTDGRSCQCENDE